jgi:hypothetical protein
MLGYRKTRLTAKHKKRKQKFYTNLINTLWLCSRKYLPPLKLLPWIEEGKVKNEAGEDTAYFNP